MVEPDELGAIHCYIRRGPDKPWTEIFGETFSCKVRRALDARETAKDKTPHLGSRSSFFSFC